MGGFQLRFKGTSIKSLFGRITALRGTRNLAVYPILSRFLRSVCLALHPKLCIYRSALNDVLLIAALLLSGQVIADEANVSWSQLTAEQRQVLNPLASEWDTLRPWQREKMLDIARDYPKMSLNKQELVKKRLSNWSRMTPYERENARKRHQQFQSLPADKKNELRKKWQEYQKLPESERARLRAESPDTYTDADLD